MALLAEQQKHQRDIALFALATGLRQGIFTYKGKPINWANTRLAKR
jgi:hypothetical protein